MSNKLLYVVLANETITKTVTISSQLVFDDSENKARFDLLVIADEKGIHEDLHLDLSRKQALKMIAILEKHVLHNRE